MMAETVAVVVGWLWQFSFLINNQSRKLEPEVHDSCISDKDDNRSEWVRTRNVDIWLNNRDKKIV